MSASVVKRAKGRYAVVVEEGRHPARRCTVGPRHRVWVDEHRADECPRCGEPLGPVVTARRQRWHGPYPTKRDAEDAAKRLGVAFADGMYAPPTTITLAEYLAERWLPAVAAQYRPTTITTYRANIANHVLPRLGATRLRDLRPEHLNRFYAELLADGRVQRPGRRGRGLSARTVSHVHKIVHRALRDAVRWRLIVRNPADDADPPRPQRTETTWWGPEQLRAFVSTDPDDRLAGLWHLVATTGMRRGELVGLRWRDVDLDGARLSIASTITTAGYVTHVGEPKTESSRRVVPLDPTTVAAIRRHRTRQAAERLAAGEAWNDSGLVFVREDGAPLHPQTVTYLFKRRAARAGLPPIRLHDVRHSYAVAALSAGEHPKAVQERLGHSSSAITSDLYSHVTEGVARESADRVAALILGGS